MTVYMNDKSDPYRRNMKGEALKDGLGALLWQLIFALAFPHSALPLAPLLQLLSASIPPLSLAFGDALLTLGQLFS